MQRCPCKKYIGAFSQEQLHRGNRNGQRVKLNYSAVTMEVSAQRIRSSVAETAFQNPASRQGGQTYYTPHTYQKNSQAG